MVEGRDYFFYNQDAESYLMQFGHNWNKEGIKNNIDENINSGRASRINHRNSNSGNNNNEPQIKKEIRQNQREINGYTNQLKNSRGVK